MHDPCDYCPNKLGSAACRDCRYNEDFWAMPAKREEGQE